MLFARLVRNHLQFGPLPPSSHYIWMRKVVRSSCKAEQTKITVHLCRVQVKSSPSQQIHMLKLAMILRVHQMLRQNLILQNCPSEIKKNHLISFMHLLERNQTTRSVGNTVLNSTQQQLHAEDDHAIHHSVSKRKGATQTLFVVSQASGEVQAHVHEIELQMDSAANQSSKIALVLVEVLMLGTFGIDRCMTGQICLGFVKGLTLGACGVWTLIDYIFIIANCLGRYESLNALGYHVTFYQNGIEPAFVITLVGIIVKVCFTCALRFRAYFAVKGHMESEGLPDRA